VGRLSAPGHGLRDRGLDLNGRRGTEEIERTDNLDEISSSRQSGHINLIQFDLQWKFRNVHGMR
jgi:hypothetical protein